MDIKKLICALKENKPLQDDEIEFINTLDEDSIYYLQALKFAHEITCPEDVKDLTSVEVILNTQVENAKKVLDINNFAEYNLLSFLNEHIISLDFDIETIRKYFANGLYPMSGDINGTNILFVRHHDIKLIIKPEDFRVPHNIQKLINKKFQDYTITFNKDFEGCLKTLQEVYPENWFYPELVKAYIHIHNNPDSQVSLNSVEIWHEGKLVAGEIGFITGNAYASLSGFHKENDIGNVQMALLGQYLFENGFAYWDLGMSIPYKYRFGAKDCNREKQFLYHEALSKTRISFPEDEVSVGKFWHANSLSGKDEVISTRPEDLIKFHEPNTVFSDFGRQICDIDFGFTGDIPLQKLYSAYMQGVFPWFNEESEYPAWYSTDPRFVLMPQDFHCPKSLKKFMKKCPYTFSMDRCFRKVMKNCAEMDRPDQNSTWIGQSMINVYTKFHKAGYAHSFEVWYKGQLAGGFYGVLIGSVFFGESMFTLKDNASKCALTLFMKAFTECGGTIVDCQSYTDNLARYGAKNISRDAFLRIEQDALYTPLKSDLKTVFEDLVRSNSF